MTHKVAVISVCLNDEEALPPFLANVQQWTYKAFEYIFVDNASTDATPDLLRAQNSAFRVVQAHRNLGTTGGYNRGIRMAAELRVDYVMLLALDVLLEPESLRILIGILDDNPDIAAVGPILFKSHDPTLVESMGFQIDERDWTITTHLGGQREPRDMPGLVDASYIDGGTSLFRLSALQKVGLLDERLFMYGEDVDICIRLRRAGFRVVSTSKTRAWHRHTEIRRAESVPRPYYLYYVARNMLYLVRKHSTKSGRRAYYRRVVKALPRTLAYFSLRKKKPALGLIHLEGIVHGMVGKMGKTKYVL